MTNRHPSNALRPALPTLWLVSDARNDARLECTLARLPRGCALIYRHYHLPEASRRARYLHLARRARRFGHLVILAGDIAQARAWQADGAYGPAKTLHKGASALRLVTVHSLRELRQARTARADAVLVSPVFTTRSHAAARPLGTLRFRAIAVRSTVPVIALGGMNAPRARHMRLARWAAIDGLCGESPGSFTARRASGS